MVGKETVFSHLEREKKISRGLIVRTLGNLVKFEITGFIPNTDDFFSIEDVAVGLTAVRIKDTSPKYNTPIFIYLPIAKSVIISNDVLVKIDYKRPFYVGNNKITKTIRQDCKSLLKYQSNLFTLKDETLWYKKDPSDVILKCDGRIVSVSNKFACVCSYISPISGKLEYTIKTPEELILTIDE